MESERRTGARRRRIGAALFLAGLAVGLAVAAVGASFGDAVDVRVRAGAAAPAPSRPAASGPHRSRTLVASGALPVTIRGSSRGVLYPGGAVVPVELLLTNPNARPIVVTSATVRVTGTSAPGCGAGNFVVARRLAATPTVRAGATVSLGSLGVPLSRWPALRMADAGRQDACKGATVYLAFAGTARG